MIEDPVTPARRRFPRLLLIIIAVDTVLVAALIFWLATREGTPPQVSNPSPPRPPEARAAE